MLYCVKPVQATVVLSQPRLTNEFVVATLPALTAVVSRVDDCTRPLPTAVNTHQWFVGSA